jgi:hypothetical protein
LKEISELIIALKPVAVAISVSNRIVRIIDESDIAILFYDVLKSIARITIFTFTDPIHALEHFRLINMLMR